MIFNANVVVFERTLIVAGNSVELRQGSPEDWADWAPRSIALEKTDGFGGIGVAGFDVGISQHVESGREIGVDVENLLHHLAGAAVVLLKVKPFGREIEDVLVGRETGEQIVHGSDGGEVVAQLNIDHPIDKELLVRGRLGSQGLGALESFGIAGWVRFAA